jgi:predicted nucleic acid-binding protein
VRRVFVDTGGFFAHLIVSDANHKAARAVFTRALQEDWELHTTNTVLYETHALLVNRARDGRAVALSFLDTVDQGLCEVERVEVEDEEDALAILRSHSDKAFSYCDALSFVVMERMNLEEVIAFDRHFREYGRFRVLP